MFGKSLFVLGGLLLATASNSAHAIENFTYSFHRIKFQKKGTWLDYVQNGLNLILEIKVDNPTSTSIQFDSFIGTAFLGTQTLTDINIKDRVIIAPNDTTIISTDLRIRLLSAPTALLNEIKNIIATQTITTKVLVKGTLVLQGVRYPVNQLVSLSGE